jgi:hypothetical protein
MNTTHAMPTNGQRNILVIGVDDLESDQPKLAGIWLMLYFPEKPNITFVPIFPDPRSKSSSKGLISNESLVLNEDSSLKYEFVNKLQRKNLWWHGYVVMDAYAVAEVFALFNQTNQKNSVKYGNSITDWVLPGEFPQSIAAQMNLISMFCRKSSYLTGGTDISRIVSLVPNHIRTDMNMTSFIQDWRHFIASESELNCDFPIYQASNP